MLSKSKILSSLLCFCLLFEQTGLAQVAGTLDISNHIAAFRNSLVQDKFRPLHLRYLSYDPKSNDFKLLLDKGDFFSSRVHEFAGSRVKTINSKTQEPANTRTHELDNSLTHELHTLMEYFFIGLTLPNESFWVNLRPESEDNVIDSELAKTDIGKIMLEADVYLKKDTALYTSPQTAEGKKYWDKLYKKAEELYGYDNITIPTLTRPWIVPGEIIIRETPDNAYIYKATLKVMLEEDYLKNVGADLVSARNQDINKLYEFNDPRAKELNTYSTQLIKKLIIPKLTKDINTTERYAALRQIYYSLILAQWFKQRFRAESIVDSPLSIEKTKDIAGIGLAPVRIDYKNIINSSNLTGLVSKIPWSKDTYYQQYQKSFKDGEYNIKQPAATPLGQTIRSYFSGGVSFGTEISKAVSSGIIKGNPKINIVNMSVNSIMNNILIRAKASSSMNACNQPEPENSYTLNDILKLYNQARCAQSKEQHSYEKKLETSLPLFIEFIQKGRFEATIQELITIMYSTDYGEPFKLDDINLLLGRIAMKEPAKTFSILINAFSERVNKNLDIDAEKIANAIEEMSFRCRNHEINVDVSKYLHNLEDLLKTSKQLNTPDTLLRISIRSQIARVIFHIAILLNHERRNEQTTAYQFAVKELLDCFTGTRNKTTQKNIADTIYTIGMSNFEVIPLILSAYQNFLKTNSSDDNGINIFTHSLQNLCGYYASSNSENPINILRGKILGRGINVGNIRFRIEDYYKEIPCYLESPEKFKKIVNLSLSRNELFTLGYKISLYLDKAFQCTEKAPRSGAINGLTDPQIEVLSFLWKKFSQEFKLVNELADIEAEGITNETRREELGAYLTQQQVTLGSDYTSFIELLHTQDPIQITKIIIDFYKDEETQQDKDIVVKAGRKLAMLAVFDNTQAQTALSTIMKQNEELKKRILEGFSSIIIDIFKTPSDELTSSSSISGTKEDFPIRDNKSFSVTSSAVTAASAQKEYRENIRKAYLEIFKNIPDSSQLMSRIEDKKVSFPDLLSSFLLSYTISPDFEIIWKDLVSQDLLPLISDKKESLKRIIEYIERHQYNRGSKEEALAIWMGKLAAFGPVESIKKDAGYWTNEVIPGNENLIPIVNQKPYFDLGAGPRALKFFKNLSKDRRYFFVDLSKPDDYYSSVFTRQTEIPQSQINKKSVSSGIDNQALSQEDEQEFKRYCDMGLVIDSGWIYKLVLNWSPDFPLSKDSIEETELFTDKKSVLSLARKSRLRRDDFSRRV